MIVDPTVLPPGQVEIDGQEGRSGLTAPAASGLDLNLDAAFELLFGERPTGVERARLHELVGLDRVNTLSALRTIVMGHDRQSRPTRALIRFSHEDVRWLDVEGFRLALDAADLSVSAPMLAQHAWEPHLTSVFRRYVRPGMRVADIGANVGYYTMLAAQLVTSEGEVFAFEPNSENCRLTLMSVAENGWSNVRLFPLALAETTGLAYFSSHIGSNGGLMPADSALATGHGLIVPTARLDSLVDPPLDFIKMDVEGAEFRVLRGAQSLISAARPVITTEFSCEMIARVSKRAPRDVLGFFEQYGYSVHLIHKPSGRLDAVPDIDALLRDWGDLGRIEDLLMLPRGIPVRQPE